jgi:hypothetical protein
MRNYVFLPSDHDEREGDCLNGGRRHHDKLLRRFAEQLFRQFSCALPLAYRPSLAKFRSIDYDQWIVMQSNETIILPVTNREAYTLFG